MFRSIIINILKEIYPMMIVCSILAIILRLAHLKKYNKSFVLHKEIICIMNFIGPIVFKMICKIFMNKKHLFQIGKILVYP